ncbi:PadR family transcriptional regulator [Crossiella sp. SN42]|uniref:PadR family transcriptional regulator n=1 Tax=Crossiella sp. SN42 TaxID=2944808 RepID=UPI00207D540B|nr:helix-turn-helix transcriptional regulator [Crossiella sp. SN42]MCO1575536.1 PadR family transcriptional regulator [Crossiella sp. SN42]
MDVETSLPHWTIYLYICSFEFMGRRLRATEATLDVLEILLGPDEQLYGLKIAKAANRATGSVFPILARLEEFGWVVSEWETDDPTTRGPRRRFYRLSPDGVGMARVMLAEHRQGRRQVGRSSTPRIVPRPEAGS